MAAGVLKTVTPFLRGAGHALVGEIIYERSNKEVTLAPSASKPYLACQPLGKLTAGGQYTHWDPALSNGAQTLAGFLWDDRPASAAAQRGVATVREVDMNAHAIPGYEALSTGNKAALIAAAEAMSIILLV